MREIVIGERYACAGPNDQDIRDKEAYDAFLQQQKYQYNPEDEIPEGVEYWEDIATDLPVVGRCRKCGQPVYEDSPTARGWRYCSECIDWAIEMCSIDESGFGFSTGRGAE